MSWRTSLAGIPAGLAFLLSALSQPGPWSWPRALLALGGALLAVLATFAGDHRSQAAPADSPRELADVRAALARLLEQQAARTVDPPNPDAAPRVVLPSFEDAVKIASKKEGEP